MSDKTERKDSEQAVWLAARGKLLAGGVVAIVAAAVVAMAIWLPGRKRDSDPSPPEPVNVTVEVIEIISTLADTFELDGKVEPNVVVRVSAEVAGRIERYGEYKDANGRPSGRQLRKGDRIRAGEPLVYIDKSVLQARYDCANASYEFDRRDYDRVRKAHDRKVATPLDLDLAKTKIALSKAALAEARAMRDRTTILAPVSGIVNRLPVEVGERAEPGEVCAEIVDVDTVKIVVNVPEREIAWLDLDEKQRIFDRLDSTLKLTAPITYISAVADEQSLTTRVEITVPNKDRRLHAGTTVNVRLKRRDLKDVIMIPLAAVIPLEKGHMVYVVNDGKAKAITVKIDIRSIRDDRVRIDPKDSLKAGDKLIVEGYWRCGPGQAVRIIGDPATMPATKPATAPSSRPTRMTED